MPNIASVFKEEIARVARKLLRDETARLKKAATQHRAEIAALKRRVATLEQHASRLERKAARTSTPQATSDPARPVRFSAKGLLKHRQRLGLSAAGMAALLGVSAQTIYNWEAGNTRPRGQQLAQIAAVRAMSKSKAETALGTLAAE